MLRYYGLGGHRHTQSSDLQRAAQSKELAEAIFSLGLPVNHLPFYFLF